MITEGTIEYKIVEKAALKLKMDHLVIQKGRLTQNTTKKLNKAEMQEWISFGAQEILKTSGENSSKIIDIEKILEDSLKT